MFLAIAANLLTPMALRAAGHAGTACLRLAAGCMMGLAEAHAGRADLDETRSLPPFY